MAAHITRTPTNDTRAKTHATIRKPIDGCGQKHSGERRHMIPWAGRLLDEHLDGRRMSDGILVFGIHLEPINSFTLFHWLD